MKRKSIFTFCAIALMLVLSLSVLTACNKDGKHKEYTITFDSKGGSAVQPIKASAGAAITAPTDPTKDGFVLQAGMKARTAARRFPTRHSVFHICRQEFSRFTQSGRLPTLRARLSIKLTQLSSGSPKPPSKRSLQTWERRKKNLFKCKIIDGYDRFCGGQKYRDGGL